jgi:hypothetical protein
MRALVILGVFLPLIVTTPALAQNAQSIQQQPDESKFRGGHSWTAGRGEWTFREAA